MSMGILIFLTGLFAVVVTQLPPPPTSIPISTTTWSPVTKSTCNNVLYAGDCLALNQTRISCNSCFQLIFQPDGNLVVYTNSVPKKVIWSPNIHREGGVKACMQTDGSFVVSNSSGGVVWSAYTGVSGTIAKIQDDGQFVIADNSVRYSSKNTGTCVTSVCGTFAKLDASNSISNFGFPGGVFTDNTTAYVGYGNNTNCHEQDKCPGRISTLSAGPGAYMSCDWDMKFDAINVYFAEAHEDLKWIPTDTNTMNNYSGRVQVNSASYNFLIGRKTLANNYQTVSKIHNGPPGPGDFWYIESNGTEKAIQSGFDVLVCDPNPPCGTFVYYDANNNPNAPFRNGFIGGITKDGSVAFVGRGNNALQGQNPCPGRISTKASAPGAYMPAGCDTYDKNGSYYLLDHPDLHYVSTTGSGSSSLAGGIKFVSSSNHTFGLGRVMINGYAYLGKIHVASSFHYIQDSGSETGITSGFEMLTCNSALNTPTPACKNKISAGRCLAPGENIWSCLGYFRLAFQVDGNLVIYTKSGAVVWTSNTYKSDAQQACMQADGKFVLYNAAGVSKWSSNWSVANTNTEAYGLIQDDGQFVVNVGGLTKFTTGKTAVCAA